MSHTAVAFLGAYVLLLGLAFIRHPVYGLFAYLLAFYNHPPSRWWGDQLPDWRWSLIAAVVALAAAMLDPRTRNRAALKDLPSKLIVAYTIWMGAQLFWAVQPESARDGAILFAKYVVLLVLIVKTIDTPERFDQLVWAHIAGCFVFAWIAWRDPHLTDGRLEGIGGPGASDSNTLAVHLATGLAFAGWKLLSSGWTGRVAALGACAFIMNAIILCNSRGAFVGMGAAGVAAVLLAPRGTRKIVISLGVLAVVMLVVLAHDQFWERIQTLEDPMQESSAASRWEFVGPSIRMFQDHPLGAGHEGFRALSGRYIPTRFLARDGTRSPHTTLLAVLVEQGFVGVILYLGIMLAALRDLFRLRRLAAESTEPRARELSFYVAAIGCGLVSFGVSGVASSYLKAEAQIWLLGLLAAAGVLLREIRAAEERKAAEAQAAPAAREAGSRETTNIPGERAYAMM